MKRLVIIKVVLAAIGFILAGVALCVIAIWLRSPPHEAYLELGQLYNIHTGLRIYQRAHGHLPLASSTDSASGQKVSWRIEVFESLDSKFGFNRDETTNTVPMVYDRNKPWNDRANLRLDRPARRRFSTLTRTYRYSDVRNRNAFFKAITGPGTAFDGNVKRKLEQLPNDLILIVEVADSDTHWMQPGDLSLEQVDADDNVKRVLLTEIGYVVLFADGERWVLSSRTPASDLRRFFTIDGATNADRAELLGPYIVLSGK